MSLEFAPECPISHPRSLFALDLYTIYPVLAMSIAENLINDKLPDELLQRIFQESAATLFHEKDGNSWLAATPIYIQSLAQGAVCTRWHRLSNCRTDLVILDNFSMSAWINHLRDNPVVAQGVVGLTLLLDGKEKGQWALAEALFRLIPNVRVLHLATELVPELFPEQDLYAGVSDEMQGGMEYMMALLPQLARLAFLGPMHPPVNGVDAPLDFGR